MLEKLKTAVIKAQEDEIKGFARHFIEEGYDALDGIVDGLEAGMEVVGDLYDRQEYFVPELLICADALYAGLDILRPHVSKLEKGTKYQIVIGSIQGDVHDIGKNLVKMMFDVAGWKVNDLGVDVPVNKFIEEQQRTDSDIIAISAMMTSTMMGMKKAVKIIKEKKLNAAIMLGGAPITKDVAKLFGADGYADSAVKAVSEGTKLVSHLHAI
ncbi:MAG: cobalamin-binding protein [Deltaproteobacteria bacterium]|nr:MAG: cobalamin-binding protein [Deltaproteobacteria bacterium]